MEKNALAIVDDVWSVFVLAVYIERQTTIDFSAIEKPGEKILYAHYVESRIWVIRGVMFVPFSLSLIIFGRRIAAKIKYRIRGGHITNEYRPRFGLFSVSISR